MIALSVDESQPVEGAAALSFERVYRAQFDFVWRVLRGMGVAEAQLEDATQEVFMVVLKKLESFDGRANVKTWLFEIALRVASNQRRTVRRKGGHASLNDELPHRGPGPAEIAESRRSLEMVLSIMDSLDEPLRVVLFLTELEQMTTPEIAALTGWNINTISARLRRARETFGKELARRRAEP
jgi:RNA polymerase sigma-70 factor (ECF subfamily)